MGAKYININNILLIVYSATIFLSIILANVVFGQLVIGEVFSIIDRIILPMVCGLIIGPIGCLVGYAVLKICKIGVVAILSVLLSLLVNSVFLIITFSLFIGG